MILSKDIRILEIGSQRIYHDGTNLPLPRMEFDPDAIVGWEDSPDIKRDISPRPNSHGDFYDKGFYEGKLITISGFALAANPVDLHAMRDKLVGILNSEDEQWVRVEDLAGSRFMKISQGSKLSWIQELDTYARWKVDLYAADPRMYGLPKYAQTYSTTLDTSGLEFPLGNPLSFGANSTPQVPTLVNLGNAEAWPIFTVNANLPSGFTITSGYGKIVTFFGATFEGSPVEIDMFEGTASVSGVDRSYQLTTRQWFSIPPNGSIKPKYIPTVESNSWASVTWRDTWA